MRTAQAHPRTCQGGPSTMLIFDSAPEVQTLGCTVAQRAPCSQTAKSRRPRFGPRSNFFLGAEPVQPFATNQLRLKIHKSLFLSLVEMFEATRLSGDLHNLESFAAQLLESAVADFRLNHINDSSFTPKGDAAPIPPSSDSWRKQV